MRDTLAALIERVEQATGPDLELDAAIVASLKLYIIALMSGVPHYTASIDAAVSLVPEGWVWVVGNMGNAHVYEERTAGKSVTAEAATPALALTAAALRARMESER